MRKRYIYTLLFLVPGLFASLLITSAVFAVVFGALWLYVFGDSPWPESSRQVLPLLMLVVFGCLWAVAIVTGYLVGKRLEAAPGFDVGHLWISLGATLLPIAMVLLHQLSVGKAGLKSDWQLCSEYCGDLGYATSSMPSRDSGDRTCSCRGQFGEAEVTLPIDELPR
jgi:cytochrome bd-type quinol oxidase subunit 2